MSILVTKLEKKGNKIVSLISTVIITAGTKRTVVKNRNIQFIIKNTHEKSLKLPTQITTIAKTKSTILFLRYLSDTALVK